MRRIAAIPVLLLLASLASADPPALDIPAEIKALPGKWVVVAPKTTAKAVVYVGLDALEAFPSSELKDPRKLVLQAPLMAGRWRFVAVGTLGDELAQANFVIIVGDVPPVPPTPPVPPIPPVPPVPTNDLHVLVVYETATISKLPPAQYLVMFDKSVRDYLNAKCVVGTDGKTKEWAMWDKDIDPAGYSKPIVDALRRPRAAVPWLHVFDSKGNYAFEGPLPANTTDMLTLLRKFGG